MPKVQWERLPMEKWAHLRDRAKERQISKQDLFELAEWKAEEILTYPMAIGSRISERSSCVAQLERSEILEPIAIGYVRISSAFHSANSNRSCLEICRSFARSRK